MILDKEVKEIVRRYDKKIGKQALKYLKQELIEVLEDKIGKAARQADFSGRKIIKQADFS